MTTATAHAFANIEFTIFTLAKLGQTDRKVCFGAKLPLADGLFYMEDQEKLWQIISSLEKMAV